MNGSRQVGHTDYFPSHMDFLTVFFFFFEKCLGEKNGLFASLLAPIHVGLNKERFKLKNILGDFFYAVRNEAY